MITAAQARTLSGPTLNEQVKEHLEVISKVVETAAANKQRSVTIRHEPYGSWLYGTVVEPALSTVAELRKLGYTIDFFYEERQFVDMGLRISW